MKAVKPAHDLRGENTPCVLYHMTIDINRLEAWDLGRGFELMIPTFRRAVCVAKAAW